MKTLWRWVETLLGRSITLFGEIGKYFGERRKIFFWRGCVPDSKSRNIPEVIIVRRGAVGVLEIWRGWESWVKGGANGVSLQAT